METNDSSAVDFWTKSAIEDEAAEIVQEYFDDRGLTSRTKQTTDIQGIYESVIYPRYEIKLVTDLNLGSIRGAKILGKTIPEVKTILIDKSICPPANNPQYVFTMAHEFGHAVLHSSESLQIGCTNCDLSQSGGVNTLERQANWFAANLLMPENLVRYYFEECYWPLSPVVYSGPRQYWLDVNGEFRSLSVSSYKGFCSDVGAPLCGFFSNISKTSMGLRLHTLGLIENNTSESWRCATPTCHTPLFDYVPALTG